ncbi:HlyD family secretion protein [uncultured Pedobacter sp.]|uniref:HlyD family secretion protein n=1 Tax=Pedobacter sp. KLB.chiD TaxID=3387402 RepID=UPI0025F4DFE9|nr:secretion protein HlyD [uncultured Pedobacter sp.]
MPLPPNAYSHSDEVNDIITAVPSWILRRGIALIFIVLLSIILLSALIRYPDVVKTTLKVSSLNAPKEVISHQAGKLIKILVKDDQIVKNHAPLAFIESTASHEDVILLAEKLNALRKKVGLGLPIKTLDFTTNGLNLGELQGSFQVFYQQYVEFASTQHGGFYLNQKEYLQKDLKEIKKLQQLILQQKKIQEQEFANFAEEYEAYKKLKSKNVISQSEFKQQENKYLSGKYPLQQTATALLNNSSAYLAKQKELAALENTIREQQGKFLQSLNTIVNETQSWLMKYVVRANTAGRVSYVGILQENQNVAINQPLFIVNPGNNSFFGEVQIPQYNMGKVHSGQKVLIKLKSYPFEEFGMIKGRVTYITDFALKDSVFLAKIEFGKLEQKDSEHKIRLKPGMTADAEILTRESSLLQRFARNMVKIFDQGR